MRCRVLWTFYTRRLEAVVASWLPDTAPGPGLGARPPSTAGTRRAISSRGRPTLTGVRRHSVSFHPTPAALAAQRGGCGQAVAAVASRASCITPRARALARTSCFPVSIPSQLATSGKENASHPPGWAAHPPSAGLPARHIHPRATAPPFTPLLRATCPPSRLLLPASGADDRRYFSPPAFPVCARALGHGRRCRSRDRR